MQSSHAKVFAKPQEKILNWYKKNKIGICHDRHLAIFHHTFCLRVLEIIARPDINSKLKPLTKFTSSSKTIEVKDILPWNIYQMIMKTILVSQLENSHKLCNKIGHLLYSLKESQWKLRQKHDQHFPMKVNNCRTNTSTRTKKKIQKSRTVRVTVRNPSRVAKLRLFGIWAEFTRSINSTSPYDRH